MQMQEDMVERSLNVEKASSCDVDDHDDDEDIGEKHMWCAILIQTNSVNKTQRKQRLISVR